MYLTSIDKNEGDDDPFKVCTKFLDFYNNLELFFCRRREKKKLAVLSIFEEWKWRAVIVLTNSDLTHAIRKRTLAPVGLERPRPRPRHRAAPKVSHVKIAFDRGGTCTHKRKTWRQAVSGCYIANVRRRLVEIPPPSPELPVRALIKEEKKSEVFLSALYQKEEVKSNRLVIRQNWESNINRGSELEMRERNERLACGGGTEPTIRRGLLEVGTCIPKTKKKLKREKKKNKAL